MSQTRLRCMEEAPSTNLKEIADDYPGTPVQ